MGASRRMARWATSSRPKMMARKGPMLAGQVAGLAEPGQGVEAAGEGDRQQDQAELGPPPGGRPRRRARHWATPAVTVVAPEWVTVVGVTVGCLTVVGVTVVGVWESWVGVVVGTLAALAASFSRTRRSMYCLAASRLDSCTPACRAGRWTGNTSDGVVLRWSRRLSAGSTGPRRGGPGRSPGSDPGASRTTPTRAYQTIAPIPAASTRSDRHREDDHPDRDEALFRSCVGPAADTGRRRSRGAPFADSSGDRSLSPVSTASVPVGSASGPSGSLAG